MIFLGTETTELRLHFFHKTIFQTIHFDTCPSLSLFAHMSFSQRKTHFNCYFWVILWPFGSVHPVKFTIYDPIAKIYSVKFSFLTCQLQKFVPWKFTANKMYAHKVIGSLVAGSGSQDLVYQWKVCTPGSLEGVLARSHNRCWWVHGTISEAWEITLKTIYCRLSSILSGCLDNLSPEPSPELINNSLLDEPCMFYQEHELFKESYLKRRKWKHCTNFGCIVWSWRVIKPCFTRICKKMIWTCSFVVESLYLLTLQCTKITTQGLGFLF